MPRPEAQGCWDCRRMSQNQRVEFSPGAAHPRWKQLPRTKRLPATRSNFLIHGFSLFTIADSDLRPLYFHRMTRSALTNTFGGIVRPICFAVFKLITNSNFIGCSTGRSAGLALSESCPRKLRRGGTDPHCWLHRTQVHRPLHTHFLSTLRVVGSLWQGPQSV